MSLKLQQRDFTFYDLMKYYFNNFPIYPSYGIIFSLAALFYFHCLNFRAVLPGPRGWPLIGSISFIKIICMIMIFWQLCI